MMRTDFIQNLIILIRRMPIMSPVNKTLWLHLTLPRLPPRELMKTSCTLGNGRRKTRREVGFRATRAGGRTGAPVSAFLGGNEIEQQGSVNPIFSTLAPSSQSQQKAQRLGKTPFPHPNQFPVVCCVSVMLPWQPSILHLPLSPACLPPKFTCGQSGWTHIQPV